MKFENTQVFGFENSIIGMRLPLCKDFEVAKNKSTSRKITIEDMKNCDFVNLSDSSVNSNFIIGEDDLRISKNLILADENSSSQPNSKFLRMIHCQVAITAPLYMWKEISTYKVGTTANSTSTMHTLSNKPITKECFEMGDYKGDKVIDDYWEKQIEFLETLRQTVVDCKNQEDKKRYWKELVRLLPTSWLQTRMFDCDYATLRNIYHWRKNHKLSEWHKFCDWIKTLPYFEELINN